MSVTPNDPTAAAANRTALLALTGPQTLPAGQIAMDAAPVLQRANAGLVLAGNGTTLKNVGTANDWVGGRALAIRPGADGLACLSFYEPPASRPDVMPTGQVGWLFNQAGSDGQQFYPAPVQRIGPREKVPKSELSFMRAYRGVPFGIIGHRDGILALVPIYHGLQIGDDVFATDGPLINEVVPEWRRITAIIAPDVIEIDRPLTRTYSQGTLVSGPLPRKMAFQGLRFSSSWGPVLVQQACDVAFIDCTFDQSQGWTSVIGCGRVTFVNCAMPSGFQSSTSHDIQFRGCTIREVVGEQAATNLSFEYCRLGPGTVDSKVQCTDWWLRHCVTTGWLFVYDSWLVENHVAYGPVVVRGRAAVVRDLWCADTVTVQATYQGQPEKSGTGVTLERVRARAFVLGAGTSGTMRACVGPVSGDTSGWSIVA